MDSQKSHSIWHNANEIPITKRYLIVVYPDGNNGFIPKAEFHFSVKYWADRVKDNKVVKWCYFDDII